MLQMSRLHRHYGTEASTTEVDYPAHRCQKSQRCAQRRQEIAREVPCCPSCLKLLESGETLEELVKHPPKPSKPTAQVVRATVARDRRAKNRR